jgi:ribosomal protein L40E
VWVAAGSAAAEIGEFPKIGGDAANYGLHQHSPFPSERFMAESVFIRTCPDCGAEVSVDATRCRHCGARLDAAPGAAPVFDYPPTILTVPIIISAVWNVMTAIGWATMVPCIGLVIAVPYTVLAIFEVSTFVKAPAMPPHQLYRRCGPLGIFQIVLGLTNLVPVVCGILLLAYRDRLHQYHGPQAG